jgi:hypothetical protein
MKSRIQRQLPGNGMNGVGDMEIYTGYPVMVVIKVVITKIERDATTVPVGAKENMAGCFCI